MLSLRGPATRALLGAALKTTAARTSTAPAVLRAPRGSALSLLASNGGWSRAPLMASGQSLAFSTARGSDEDESGKSPKEQIEALLAENAALQKEVASLKAELAKKPGKFMSMVQQFGMPFFVWWTGLYLASGIGLYVALDTGLLPGDQAIDFLMSLGADKYIDPARLDPKYGNLAIAIVVNECLEVIRFPITVATMPYFKKYLWRSKDANEAK